MKNKILILAAVILLVTIGLVTYAYIRIWGKTELVIKLHINGTLVQKSAFGESPTFAIWLENTDSHEIRAVYVTRRAAENDWEGKVEVPAALPRWFEIEKAQYGKMSRHSDMDSYTGATPKPGYFTVNADLAPGSNWICWLEVNLAGDYNDFYSAKSNEDNESDKYSSGQPAILYRGEITAKEGLVIAPTLVAMTESGAIDGRIIQPMHGITTATEIFDEISISVVQPNPKIFR
jgi:hypothetical protein